MGHLLSVCRLWIVRQLQSCKSRQCGSRLGWHNSIDADKKNAFYELIFLKSFSREEASKRLGLSESSSFFDIFGVKTTFWKVSFFMQRFKVCAVVCAVPGENEKIAEYRVMELFVEEK